MFTNFELPGRDVKLTGSSWECENPAYVLCIIHGIGEHDGRYDRLAGEMTKNGIAVLGMDLRGHGRSAGKRGDTAPRKAVLEDIDALLAYGEEKYPGLPINLYGHSMGGNLVIDYRNRGNRNDLPAKYIISAPWIKLVRSVPRPLYVLVKGLAHLMPEFAMSSGCPKEYLGNPGNKDVDGYDRDELVHGRITLRCAVDGYDTGNAFFDGTFETNGRADGTPTLLMHGDADKICSVEGSRALAEQNRDNEAFTYIEGKGYYHEIHNGGPEASGDKVIETIRDYIID